MMLITIISFIIVLGLLIFFHEFGHYFVAKLVDIRVEEFALGFGPKLVSHRKGETIYSIRAVPLGGFCSMTGEEVPDENADQEARQIYEETLEAGRCFHQKSLPRRFAVVFMGPLMNFVLAFLLFVIYFAAFGLPVMNPDSTVIGEVIPERPAAEAGLQPGDEIRAIDGNRVEEWADITTIIHDGQEGRQLSLEYVRNGEIKSTVVVPEYAPREERVAIGIMSSYSFRKTGFFESIKRGGQTIWNLLALMYNEVVGMITGRLPADVGGPVRIASEIGSRTRRGLEHLIEFTAMLSVNLAIINLLPIPALDGGRILFFLLEAVRGKPIDPRKEGLIHLIGFVVLMLLMGFIIYLDIAGLF